MKTKKDMFKRDTRPEDGISIKPIYLYQHDRGMLVNTDGAVRFVGRDVVVALIQKYSVTGEALRFGDTDWYMVFDRNRTIEIEGHHYAFGEVLILNFEQENVLITNYLSELNVYPVISECLDNIVEIWVDGVCMRAHQLD